MLDLTKDVQSLSTFKRNSLQFLKRLRVHGTPLVLTINGKPELIVQDVKAYQQLCELAASSVERGCRG
jgi:PHD/YefM family antitoxin component YafN of YafNO toxin-antitoxin module